MKDLNSQVPDSMIMTRVLSALPKKFNHFHSAWESVDDAKKTLDNLNTRLLNEELRLRGQETSRESNHENDREAFFVKSSNNKPAHHKNNSGNKKHGNGSQMCSNCHRSGHSKPECYRCFICKRVGHKSHKCPKNNNKGCNYASYEDSEKDGANNDKVSLIASKTGMDDDFWIIDSGASDHVTGKRELFTVYEPFTDPEKIILGNGSNMLAFGKGKIDVELDVYGKIQKGVMHDVLFVPDAKHNLLSLKQTTKKGITFSVVDNGTKCSFTRGNSVIATGSEYGSLFKINMRCIIPKFCSVANKVSFNEKDSGTLQLWHERLCHQNQRHVKHF